MELPIATDPNVLEKIYQHFTYTKDHPLELRGSFVNECVSLGVLEEGDFLGFLQAHPVSLNQRFGDRVPFLTTEQNLEMDCYRLVHVAQPWPKALLGVTLASPVVTALTDVQGFVSDVHSIDVDLHRIGSAQLWWGGDIALLFEAQFNDADIDHRDVLLHQLWELLEAYLKTQGVKQIFTYAFDPDFSKDYKPHDDSSVVKSL
jgi:hypothetical protein